MKKRHEMEKGQSFEKTRNIEASILKKLSSEAQRTVGVRSKIVCKGMRSDAEEGVAKGCKKWRKMEENVEKNMKMKETINGKLGKTKEN